AAISAKTARHTLDRGHRVPTRKLTDLAVRNLNAPETGRVTYWDAYLPGFGLRISEKGRKTWIAMYRVRGTSVMETIGTTALIPEVAKARELARQSMLKAKTGVNPVVERRVKEKEEAAKAETAANNTLASIFQRFV